MRLVPKYTVVLGATVTVILALVALVRIEITRSQLENDMRRDHRLVGRMLQATLADVWMEVARHPEQQARAEAETRALLALAEGELATQFEWHPADRASREEQRIVGDDLTSRFPVGVGARVGTLVIRERLDHIDAVVRTQLWFGLAGIAIIVVVCVATSLVMGGWLVGKPMRQLVEQARRIGQRDFAPAPAQLRDRPDELGELARELDTTGQALADSLAKIAGETDARINAVEQMRHSDRLATVGKLAAGIAHELGTPLSVVAGHAQMIHTGEVSGDGTVASARVIDNEVTRMGKIVRQLLDFARRKGPEGTTCAPGDIANRCTSLLGVMAERARVVATVDIAEPSPRALIDEDSMQQVLTNLLVNGIQAMPDGGTLAVAVERVSAARDPAVQPRPCVRISVRDSGTGIPPEVEAHMFEPFFTTKKSGEGTGLGLAVVHGIVVDHGGWIVVDTSDRGTTFSVYLEEARS
jgi:signal transduction histidine kinase